MEKPTSDEKILAALAHASVIFAFFGPLAPTLIWANQRNKSKYVRFHALQAMGYQALTFWVWFIGIFVFLFGGIILVILAGAFLSETTSFDPEFFPFILQPLIMLTMFGLWGLFFLIGIVGAVFCMIDRDFNYPLIGRWLKKQIFNGQATEAEMEEWEDNWVSGICHSTAILQLWGMITPLVVWFSQKERSLKLRFQAMQATLYQLIAFAAYMIGMIGYMVSFFVMFVGILILSPQASSTGPEGDLSNGAGIIFIIFIGIFMLIYLIAIIATPIYFLLAAIASILTIRGRNFKYPILGNILLRRMNPTIIEGAPRS